MKLSIYHYGSKTYFNLPEPTLMHKETVLKYHHFKDQDIDASLIKKIKEDNAYYFLLDQALKKLSLKPYTKKALKDKLEGSKILKDQVIFECENLGYLNDERFLEIIIEDFKHSTMSLGAFKTKMKQKGFSQELLETKLKSVDIDEKGRCLEEAKKVLKSFKPLPWLKVKEKLTQTLIRKGYHYSDINSVTDQIETTYEVDEKALLEKELTKEKNLKDSHKLFQKYLRKGYLSDTIQAVLKGRSYERD